jgi:glycosyltransferase involved in cell wall biosynthesis
LRVALDLTPLLDASTGVGTVVRELTVRVSDAPDVDAVGFVMSWRGRDRLATVAPPAIRAVRRPMAARPLRELWKRLDWPPVTWWTGPVDVVHGLNFVVPPARAAVELVTVHDLTCVRFPELCTADTLQYPTLIRRALRRGAHVHAVSSFVADEVCEVFGVSRDRVHVVANGVVPPDGGDAARGVARAGGAYVLALGTIEPRKDLPTLLAAFDALAATHRDLRLVVAGQDGWGADAFATALGRTRHRDRIVRLGWVDTATRADLLAGASVFAYPSRYEGFGLPPLEAMASGTPVVTTRTGALPEVVGDAALLVPPGDVQALADALGDVVDDVAIADRLIAAGRRRVGEFSWDTAAAQMVAVYRALSPRC